MAAPKPIWVRQAEEAKLKSEAEIAAAAKALSASAADQDHDDDHHHPHKPSSPAQADRHHAPPGPAGPSKSSAAGPGIAGGSADAPAIFTVVAKDRDSRRVLTGGARVRVRISPAAGVGGDDLDGAVKDNGDGSYAVTYVVPKRGNYMVHVDLDGSPVMGSPFPVFFSASTSATTTFPTTLPAVTSTYPNMVEEGDDSDDEVENRDDADDDDNDDGEMGELEEEYRTLQANQQNILMTLKQHRDDDASRGQAVKNQKALWDKTLEMRFLLQKAFSTSNKLPKEPIKSRFCDQDKEIEKAYADLLDLSKQTLGCMLDLQEALLERNQAAKGANEMSSDSNGQNDEWSEVQKLQRRITPFRNSEIDKWQRKTQVTTGAAALKGKLHAFNQNISDQVTGYMRDPSRMINRMYLRKSTVGVFGEDVGEPGTTKEEHNLEGDPELIDDSEFYQHLLKEFLESCDTGASESAFYASRKQQHKKRKLVDRRASKSRKIRYHVHEKIANFMAPVPMVLPPMAPKLFENLFGMGNQKPATV